MGSEKERPESLEERLKAHIGETGPITWETFVEAALYDEDEGYYRAGKERGKDYSTSPEIHPLFGKTLGSYFNRLAGLLGESRVNVLELGGASGMMATHIISALTDVSLGRYLIFEKGAERRRQDGIEWITTLGLLEPMTAFTVIVANEFFDALPFHRIARLNGTLHELYIGYEEKFCERVGPLSSGVARFLERFTVELQEKQIVEVTTSAVPVIEELSRVVTGRAVCLFFDYGYHSHDVRAGRFFEGSAVGYKGWQMHQDVLREMGKMDVTHHVNFDHLSTLLADKGWKKEGETEQYRFLCNAGILEGLSRLPVEERITAKWLIHPEGLASMISALGFSRGLPVPMPGFSHGMHHVADSPLHT